jgi:hypothetical protein
MGGKFPLFKMKNKKSQIPSTLTWFAAFIIIFFIIILFITASIIITGQREDDKITLQKYNPLTMESQRNLIKFLNTPVEFEGSKISIKELIKKWDISKGEEKENIKKTLQKEINQELPGYYFTIYRNNPGVFLEFKNNPGETSITGEYEPSLIYLVSDNGMLKISLSFNKYKGVGALL